MNNKTSCSQALIIFYKDDTSDTQFDENASIIKD